MVQQTRVFAPDTEVETRGDARAAGGSSLVASVSRSSPGVQLQSLFGSEASSKQLDADGPPDLLSAHDAALAVAFYRGKPDLYRPDVIIKIQHAVQSPETGSPDVAMVQGVARFQSRNVLDIDGMAGPRTLPRMFESGLATKTDRDSYVASVKADESTLAGLATPQERGDKLFEGILPLLAAEKIPKPAVQAVDLNGFTAFFDHPSWTILIDNKQFSAAVIDDQLARNMSSAMYHEARHVEQHHKMARMLATEGRSPAQIVAAMHIPLNIANDAFGNLLPRGVEFATAAQQFDAEFGSGRRHFRAAEAAAGHADEEGAEAAAKADPSPANLARLAQARAASRPYHRLAVEKDANDTAVDFEQSWDEATPLP